ncbi:MAG: hypothetical protein FWD06_04510 [Oscillospiraceae bacterium]|nr:hypothetical protein [Oscillospiraceae bacterium]
MLCGYCGKSCNEDAKFCSGCGTEFTPPPAQNTPPPAPAVQSAADKKNNIVVIIMAAVIALLLAGLLLLAEWQFGAVGLFGPREYIPVGGDVTTTEYITTESDDTTTHQTTTEVTTTVTTTATTTTQTGVQTTTTTRPPTTTTTTATTTAHTIPRHPAPPRPTAQSVAPTQIVLHSMVPNPHNGTVQWRVVVAIPPDLNMLTGWQPSPVFSNLTPGTMYTFQVRILGDGINTETSEEVANILPIRTPG